MRWNNFSLRYCKINALFVKIWIVRAGAGLFPLVGTDGSCCCCCWGFKNVPGNYTSCWLEMLYSHLLLFSSLSVPPSVNFNSQHSIPPYDKAEQKAAGTKTDVYLAASFRITVITITSSLPGTSRMLSFSATRQTHPLNLYGAFLHGRNIPASQAKQGGFGCIRSHRGRRDKSKGSQLGKTIIQNLPELFLEASSLSNSPGWRRT